MQTVYKKLFSPRRGRTAFFANERIAEFLDFAIQAEFAFVYEKFDLYRAFAIPAIRHKCDPIPVNLSLVRSEMLYCVCWILQFGLEEFRIHFNVLIE